MAILVGDALRRHGVRAILTGGACATLYSRGAYQSFDMDFIVTAGATQEAVDRAMHSLGFQRRQDRYIHPRTLFYVEFPRGPVAIGSDHQIEPVKRRSGAAHLLLLSPTDSCRDRLAAFYHWDDRQSLMAAVAIARRNRVDREVIRRWSLREGAQQRFDEFIVELSRGRRPRPARRPAAIGSRPRRRA